MLSLSPVLLCAPTIASESDSVEITLQGEATPVCNLPAVVTSNNLNASMSGGTVSISELVDNTNAWIKPWSIKMTFPGAMCNYNAFIHIESEMGGLKPTTDLNQVVTGTFLEQVDYTVSGTWGNIEINSFDTSSGTFSVSQQSPGPNQGDLVIELTSAGSNVPLNQGVYRDRVKVHIGAQL